MEKNRDFTTVSPSARWLLFMKAITAIPFAKEVARLMLAPELYTPDIENKDFTYWIRVMHMEGRYWSIDRLLSGMDTKNMLELSSGYSFRSLDVVRKYNVHYIDTDLPNVIDLKKQFVAALEKDISLKGKLELLPLNALDEKSFNEIISRFAPGPIAIVNEGLLMYLNMDEKLKLCRTIHKTLKQRGGCWITADIYIKKELPPYIKMNDKLQQFLEYHNIEDNKFDSFEAAAAFFAKAGFVIEKEAQPDYSKSMARPHLLKTMPPEMQQKMNESGARDNAKIQTTWRLKAV